MRNKFDEQLNELNDTMIEMGNIIIVSISRAIEALKTKDSTLAQKIMEEDLEVDRLQKRIESICFNLLIQQQPVARDLRNVTAALKMVTDMERIGDHAADISEMTMMMGSESHIDKFENIIKMASETLIMLNYSIESYIEKDKDKAQSAIAFDDIVDDIITSFSHGKASDAKEKKHKPVVDLNLCIACGKCEGVCPVDGKAVHSGNGNKAKYDYSKCIRCYCCQEICPAKAISRQD